MGGAAGKIQLMRRFMGMLAQAGMDKDTLSTASLLHEIIKRKDKELLMLYLELTHEDNLIDLSIMNEMGEPVLYSALAATYAKKYDFSFLRPILEKIPPENRLSHLVAENRQGKSVLKLAAAILNDEQYAELVSLIPKEDRLPCFIERIPKLKTLAQLNAIRVQLEVSDQEKIWEQSCGANVTVLDKFIIEPLVNLDRRYAVNFEQIINNLMANVSESEMSAVLLSVAKRGSLLRFLSVLEKIPDEAKLEKLMNENKLNESALDVLIDQVKLSDYLSVLNRLPEKDRLVPVEQWIEAHNSDYHDIAKLITMIPESERETVLFLVDDHGRSHVQKALMSLKESEGLRIIDQLSASGCKALVSDEEKVKELLYHASAMGKEKLFDRVFALLSSEVKASLTEDKSRFILELRVSCELLKKSPNIKLVCEMIHLCGDKGDLLVWSSIGRIKSHKDFCSVMQSIPESMRYRYIKDRVLSAETPSDLREVLSLLSKADRFSLLTGVHAVDPMANVDQEYSFLRELLLKNKVEYFNAALSLLSKDELDNLDANHGIRFETMPDKGHKEAKKEVNDEGSHGPEGQPISLHGKNNAKEFVKELAMAESRSRLSRVRDRGHLMIASISDDDSAKQTFDEIIALLPDEHRVDAAIHMVAALINPAGEVNANVGKVGLYLQLLPERYRLAAISLRMNHGMSMMGALGNTQAFGKEQCIEYARVVLAALSVGDRVTFLRQCPLFAAIALGSGTGKFHKKRYERGALFSVVKQQRIIPDEDDVKSLMNLLLYLPEKERRGVMLNRDIYLKQPILALLYGKTAKQDYNDDGCPDGAVIECHKAIPSDGNLALKTYLRESEAIVQLEEYCARYQQHIRNTTTKELSKDAKLAAKDKLCEINKLIKTLQAPLVGPNEKLKEFAMMFDKALPILERGSDKMAIRILKAMANIIASVLSLGAYAGIRALYSKVTRGSAAFWQSDENIMANKVKAVTNKNMAPKKKPHPATRG